MMMTKTVDNREISSLSLETPLLADGPDNTHNHYQVVDQEKNNSLEQQQHHTTDRLPPPTVTEAFSKSHTTYRARLVALLRSDSILAFLGILSFVVFGVITNNENLSLALWLWITLQTYQFVLALGLTAILGVAVVKELHAGGGARTRIWVLCFAVTPYYLSLAILVPLFGWPYVIHSQWICTLIPLLCQTNDDDEYYDYDNYGIPVEGENYIPVDAGAGTLKEAFSKQKRLFLTTGFLGLSCWLVFSSLYYYFEKDNPRMVYCPETLGAPTQCYNRYSSIPLSMYHTLIVLLGEFPHVSDYSTAGCIISIFAIIFGVAVVAVPAGLLGAGIQSGLRGIRQIETPEASLSTTGQIPTAGYHRHQLPVITRLEFQDFLSAKIGLDHEALFRMMLAMDGHHGEMVLRLTSSEDRDGGWRVDLGDFARFVTCWLLVPVSVTHTLLDSLPPAAIPPIDHYALGPLGVLVTLIFTVELLFRLYCAPLMPNFNQSAATSTIFYTSRATRFPRAQARFLEYAFGTAYGLIDVLAVIPGVLIWFTPQNEYLWALLLLRVFKAERYVSGFAYFRQILKDSRAILVYSGGVAIGLWLLSAEVMYYTERYSIDPQVSNHYSTLDGSLWLTLLNMSGESPLGDYSFWGSIVTAALGVFAVGVIAVPLGVFGAGMQDRLESLLEEDSAVLATASKEAMLATSEALRHTTTLQRRAFILVNPREADNRSKLDWYRGATMQYWSRRYQYWLGFWLAVSTTVAVLETLPAYHTTWPAWTRALLSIGETLAVLVFTLDYVLRLYGAPMSVGRWAPQGYVSDTAMRWAYATTFLAVADFLSVLPWWITVSTNSQLTDRYDGEFRLLRLCRIFNLDFLTVTCSLLLSVVRAQRRCLGRALYVVLVLWLSLGGLLWFTEHNDDQLAGSPQLPQSSRYGSLVSSSIPFAMVHLTGDFPLIDYTTTGKVVLGLTVVLAVGVAAVPAGLLAAAFTKALRRQRERERARRREAAGIIGKHVRRYMVRKRLEGIIMEARLRQMRELAERRKRTLVHRVHHYIHHDRFYRGFMLTLVLLNVLAIILESDAAVLIIIGKRGFDYFEFASVCVFTIDYLARVYSSTANPLVGCSRGRYMRSFLGLVDLISILPFWVECLTYLIEPSYAGSPDASIFRIFRIFRILLLEHFLVAWRQLSVVWSECRDTVLSTGVIAAVVWLFASCLFYEFENSSSISGISPFDSIPSSMYYTAVFLGGEWSMVDFSPSGKCLCVVVSLLGVALFAMPAGLLFEAFGDVLTKCELLDDYGRSSSKVAGGESDHVV